MKDDLIPCRKCISFAICNIKAKEILATKESHIKVLTGLMDECSLMREYASMNLIKDMVRHLRIMYGDVPQKPTTPLQRLLNMVNREDQYGQSM